VEIRGDYRLNGPIGLLNGVGGKRIEIFASEGIKTIRDLLAYEGDSQLIQRFREEAKNLETTSD
jgi:predicted RecB family nuclease